jgi:hypothetical protein
MVETTRFLAVYAATQLDVDVNGVKRRTLAVAIAKGVHTQYAQSSGNGVVLPLSSEIY